MTGPDQPRREQLLSAIRLELPQIDLRDLQDLAVTDEDFFAAVFAHLCLYMSIPEVNAFLVARGILE